MTSEKSETEQVEVSDPVQRYVTTTLLEKKNFSGNVYTTDSKSRMEIVNARSHNEAVGIVTRKWLGEFRNFAVTEVLVLEIPEIVPEPQKPEWDCPSTVVAAIVARVRASHIPCGVSQSSTRQAVEDNITNFCSAKGWI